MLLLLDERQSYECKPQSAKIKDIRHKKTIFNLVPTYHLLIIIC